MVESSLKSQVQLGEMQLMLLIVFSDIGSSCPPQSRMTIFPLLCAKTLAAQTRDMGIYFWRRRQSHSSITCLKAGSSSSLLAKFMLAPPQMTIEFSPYLSTQMQAMPVGSFSRTLHLSCTLASSIYFFKRRMASSLPTWPMKWLLPASFETATAWLAPFPPLAVMYFSACRVYPRTGMFFTQRKQSALALPKTQIFLLSFIFYL